MKVFLLYIIKAISALLLIVFFFLIAFYRGEIPADVLYEKYADEDSYLLMVDGVNVHVKVKGKGEPIFLIHGSFSSLNTWEAWEEELNPYFMTVSMDLPGHGLTGPDLKKRYNIDDYSKIVFGIADQLDLEEFHVAGNSMGGRVALKMATDHPKRILTLNLLDSSVAPKESENNGGKESSGSSPPIFKVAGHPLFSKVLLKCTPKFLFRMNLNQVYYDKNKITDKTVTRYYEMLRRDGNRQATIDRISVRLETEYEFEKLNMPVMIMWGKEDNWIPLAHGERLSELIPGSKLKVFENAGHIPMEEIPTESVAEYLSFLGIQVDRDYFSIPKYFSHVP